MTLADLPPARGGLLFVGLNPSPVSVTAGHYHQGSLGRRFWTRLAQAGVLPATTPIETADDALVAAGHGITDLIKAPTPRDTASDALLRAGVGALWQKIAIWRPAAVVFIYKRGAEVVAGRPIAEAWGHLPGVALAGRPCFLMPGPYAPVEGGPRGPQPAPQPRGVPAGRLSRARLAGATDLVTATDALRRRTVWPSSQFRVPYVPSTLVPLFAGSSGRGGTMC